MEDAQADHAFQSASKVFMQARPAYRAHRHSCVIHSSLSSFFFLLYILFHKLCVVSAAMLSLAYGHGHQAHFNIQSEDRPNTEEKINFRFESYLAYSSFAFPPSHAQFSSKRYHLAYFACAIYVFRQRSLQQERGRWERLGLRTCSILSFGSHRSTL